MRSSSPPPTSSTLFMPSKPPGTGSMRTWRNRSRRRWRTTVSLSRRSKRPASFSRWVHNGGADRTIRRRRSTSPQGKFGPITMVEMSWNINQPGRWRRPALVADIKESDTDWKRYLISRPFEAWDPRKYVEYRLFWPYSSGHPRTVDVSSDRHGALVFRVPAIHGVSSPTVASTCGTTGGRTSIR